MKKLPLVVLALFCSISTLTYAEQTLFKCTTTNGKVAKVSYGNHSFTYTFGSPSKVELKLKNSQATIVENAYITGNAWGIVFKNGSYKYDILAIDNQNYGVSHGAITVSKSGKELATIDCKGKYFLNENLYYESISQYLN